MKKILTILAVLLSFAVQGQTFDFLEYKDTRIHSRYRYLDLRSVLDSLKHLGEQPDSATLAGAFAAASFDGYRCYTKDGAGSIWRLFISDGTNWNAIAGSGGGGSGATKLHELSDVDTVGAVEGSFYQYNNTAKELQPVPGAEVRAKLVGRGNGATTDTFVLTDELVRNTNAALTTTTVPLNSSVAFEVGHTILVYSENNDTEFVKETAGVDLISPDTTAAGKYILLQGDFGFLYKSGTDEWILSGLSGQDGWQPEQSITFENAWAQAATRTTATYRLAVLGGRPFLQFYGVINAATVTGGQFMTLPAAFRPDFIQVITTNNLDSSVLTTFTVATAGGVSMGTTTDGVYRLPTELIPLF